MKNDNAPLVFWFRQDLRLTDLPALHAAIASGQPLVPVYVLDDESPGDWKTGAASRWWLHHSLAALNQALGAHGGQLHLLRGRSADALLSLCDSIGATGIYCTRCYEPWAASLESALHNDAGASGLEFRRFPGGLLFEPEQISNQAGAPFKVFTPFWKACLRAPLPAPTLAEPDHIDFYNAAPLAQTCNLEQLNLRPQAPDWAAPWGELWQPGEAGAHQRLTDFLHNGLTNYSEGRNYPALQSTSKLSAHMHFGEISPRQLWHVAQDLRLRHPQLGDEIDKFLSEMGWREFSHHLLHHFPHIPEAPFKPAFDNFPWLGSPAALAAWQKGQTGYPIVDAGMRELWQTGYMHNRVRMIVASFLTKHLLIPWRAGEQWFWDTLVDADLANNASGWQWVAGSGADASPYFRIFNPTLQGKKFDQAGEYVRQWVPELAQLPDKHLQEPAAAPDAVLKAAGITLGTDYPKPIVDHRDAREAALSAYRSISQERPAPPAER